ncbi:ATP-binding cassette domain-containing protein [Haloechinothrix sp. LS1_15]|uniref:ATP-binding cassette domain-containing protein n=1 Tax=Haloechinothrix sp. LS1_15 TaxID=2652248 RepID=UPI0029454861|nr:ATP-binding cassette domain-containing protein [Haloechinothrix sp. LS1_15]MDV6012585.1 sugar ABC transporter ATP-binding protein [Haloechinothrix sp. LS1_15]
MPETTSNIIELAGVGKNFGNIHALSDVSISVRSSEVSCILGDNGAGKSTLIKIISGLHQHSTGTYKVDGKAVKFASPRDALDRGIATVYQDLALVPLMPVWRNFFLGSELTSGFWPFRKLRAEEMRTTADAELRQMGIQVPDINQQVNTLSGGQRQVLAIARAIHFGARVLILDEPTAALGVKQAGVVLKYISAARDAGLGVIFITHNPHHAFMVGDHFTILKQGTVDLSAPRAELTLDDLTHHMAGGAELEALEHELSRMEAPDVGAVHELHEHRMGETK